MILEEILFLENKYLKSKNKFLFLSISSKNLEYLDSTFEILEKSIEIIASKEIKIILKDVEIFLKYLKIDFNDFKLLNSNLKIFLAYLLIFIFKNLNEGVKIKHKENESYAIQNINLNFLLNSVLFNIDQFKIWINLVHSKTKKTAINYDTLVWKIVLFLCDKNVLKKKNLNLEKNKTTIFVFSDYLESYNEIEIYTKKGSWVLIENEYYIYYDNFFSIRKIFKENLKSNAKFKWFNRKIIEDLLNTSYFLNPEYLTDIYSDYLLEHKLNNIHIENDYKILLKALSQAISEENLILISNISKKISIVQYGIKMKNILKIDWDGKKLWIPIMFDFRGRVFYTSTINPTHHNEFRYCLNSGEYDTLNQKYHYNNEKINEILKKHFKHLNEILIYKNLQNQKDTIKIAIIWILISIAEVFKRNLGKEVKMETFILKGISVINTFNAAELKYKDKIKIKYLMRILSEINQGVFIKWLIQKDAPASVYQHAIKCLGASSSYALKLCNLNSMDTWYDTYEYIITEFKKNLVTKVLTDSQTDQFFNRKTLKKKIMVVNYSAGLRTCWNYFLKEIEFNSLSNEEKIEIKEIFNNFYIFLHKSNFILKKNKNAINDFFKTKEKRIATYYDKAEVDFNYKIFKNSRKDLIFLSKRIVKKYKVMTTENDEKKFNISIKANYIQSLDASVVRWVLEREIMLTIHDCFMYDWLNITYLVSLINEAMNVVFHEFTDEEITKEEIFSVFILL